MQPLRSRAAMQVRMKYLHVAILAVLSGFLAGCMTHESDTTPPPARADSGSSPGMTEKTNEGVRSTR